MTEKPPDLRVERAKRRPSERNQLIFLTVRVLGESQDEVARSHGLSQGRVSQICQQVDQWHAWASAQGKRTPDRAQQRRLNLLQDRQRCEQLYLIAVQHIIGEPEPRVTERTSNRSGQTLTERTVHHHPPSVQWLKLADRASRQISQLNQRLGVDVAPSWIGQQLDKLMLEYLERTLGRVRRMRTLVNRGRHPLLSETRRLNLLHLIARSVPTARNF